MECGCVLIRDGARLERTFAIHPDYLDGDGTQGAGEVNFADLGLQLSRGFRALKVWVTVQTFGLAAFRAAIRLCILNPTSSEEHVRRVIEHFASTPAPPAGSRDEAYSDSRAGVIADPGHGVLRTVALLADVPDSTIHAVHTRAAYVDVAAGEEITRRWDSDRFFYIILSGRCDVFIDARLIRTMGPGDHFGELAARDWGGGYGYARLATVRCAEPGRLLRLTSEDFQWLVDTEPTVKAHLTKILAERLQQR
jgi:aromatic-L-amino-acid/L-tryptophan decarboxylase